MCLPKVNLSVTKVPSEVVAPVKVDGAASLLSATHNLKPVEGALMAPSFSLSFWVSSFLASKTSPVKGVD